MSTDGLHGWAERLAEELGVRADEIAFDAILELARTAAHNVMRPAAPVSTFLAGYAAGLRGGGRAEVDAALEVASVFAAPEEWLA